MPRAAPRDVTGADRVARLEEELLHTSHELSRLHRELETQRERLRRERLEREELLGVVSHELRTPVTVIAGYHRLLLSEEVGALNPEQRKFLEESHRSCRRLDGFIANLLDASRVGRGDEVLELGRAPLSPVIEGVIGMLRPLLDERSLRVSLALSPDAAEARFDRQRLEQVLTNLVGNALKFVPAGGHVEIATRALVVPENEWVRHWVELIVSDDGPGVAPSERERVFEPYVQLDADGNAGGLGLGLSICRRLVEAHGGSIGLEERPGGGACFRFTLPAEAPRRVGSEPDAGV